MTSVLEVTGKMREPLDNNKNGIAEELLGHIPMLNAFQIRRLVPYLSSDDATTIETFENSELADSYYVETINLRYGKLENKNHLFDVFANYCGYEDSTYVRLDMLKFVAENVAHYEWDAHVLLKMHGSNLARWTASMTDVLNKGDELAIYAMCDMLKRHAFVYTRTKPWTTVDSNVGKLDVTELCMLCDVCLIYLGNSRFGELKCKPEILSPRLRLLPVKLESPKTQENSEQTALSPTKELVVGVLDASQSSCTLMTLPCSPTTSKLESSKNLLAMKPDVETNVETRELPVVETSCVETSGLETQPSLTTDNPPSLSMDTLNPDLSVTKTNNNEILEKTQLKRNNMCQSETHAGQQMEETRETTLDAAQPAETNNTDIPTLPLTVKTETETNNDDIVSKETTEQIALPAAKENSPSLIITPAHEPTDHSTATTESTKKIDSQPIIKTRACTIRLEILTESDIVKRVHIHHKTDASRTSVETVETKTDRHEGTPNTRNTITRSSHQPRSVNKVVDYSDMVSDDNKSLSPPRKKQHHN